MTSAEEPQLCLNPNTDFRPFPSYLLKSIPHQKRRHPLHTGRSEQGLQGTLSQHHLLGFLESVNRKQSCFCHSFILPLTKCSLSWMRAWAGLIFHLTSSTIEVHICASLPHLHPHTRCIYTFGTQRTFLVSHGVFAASVAGSCII